MLPKSLQDVACWVQPGLCWPWTLFTQSCPTCRCKVVGWSASCWTGRKGNWRQSEIECWNAKYFLCARQDIRYEISYDLRLSHYNMLWSEGPSNSRARNAQACHPTSKCFHMHPLMTRRQIRRTAGVTVVVQGHQQLWPLTMLQCNVISTLRRSATWCGWNDSFTWHVLGQCWLYCAKWFWQPHLRKRHVWCMGLLCKCRLQEPPEHYETLWAVVSRQSRTFVTWSAWLSSCLNLAKMTSAFGVEITEQTSKNRGVAIVKSQNRTL